MAPARWSLTSDDAHAGLGHAFGSDGSWQAMRFALYEYCLRAGRNAAFEFARARQWARVEAARVGAVRIEFARVLAAAVVVASAAASAEALTVHATDEGWRRRRAKQLPSTASPARRKGPYALARCRGRLGRKAGALAPRLKRLGVAALVVD